MGWSLGWDSNWKRDIGYGVPAFCDYPTCKAKIDRGLSYVCGGEPYGGEHGCGLYFCGKHRQMVANPEQLASGTDEDDCDFIEVCECCYWNIYLAIEDWNEWHTLFDAKLDHPQWQRHKLKHYSWARWRKENPKEVDKIKHCLPEQSKGL